MCACARYRGEWRAATTHPVSIHTGHTLITRYSKCSVFSPCCYSSRTECHSYQPQYYIATSPLHSATHAPPFFPEDNYLVTRISVISPSTRSTPIILKSSTAIYFHMVPFHTSYITYAADHCYIKQARNKNYLYTQLHYFCAWFPDKAGLPQ